MSNPLFRVGEKVGLVSRDLPQFNGEYVVERVLDSIEVYQSRMSGELFMNKSNGTAYLLNQVFTNGRGVDDICWNESALRKIYPKANKSFEQLLSELKVGKIDTIEA
jgi:hypothetical protein